MPDENKEAKVSGYLTATMMGFEALVRILERKNLITKSEVADEMKVLNNEMKAAMEKELAKQKDNEPK